jgi:amidase
VTVGEDAGRDAGTDAVERSLAAIETRDGTFGAFASVRPEAARAEAKRIAQAPESRTGSGDHPLSGVPVAVKEMLDPDGDHVVVRRLRNAGAVIVGTTRMPQACLWATTDGGDVVTRNPWNRRWTAGGSSGGSGAAVAAGLVRMAHGTDGLGSVRIPAACCAVVGVKPGHGVIAPVDLGAGEWFGLSEHGALATTVADAALMLSVMAGDPSLARVEEPGGDLRVACSVTPPVAGVPVATEVVRATFAAAAALLETGARVERDGPRYPLTAGPAVTARWFAAAADEAAELDDADLEPRTRRHAAVGQVARRAVRPAEADAWREQALQFFSRYDVLVTPVLATGPLRAERWSERSWAANVVANVLSTGGFPAAWNLAGFPAVAVPGGVDPRTGLRVGIQLAGPPGSERLLLGVAASLERLRPWPRVAPAT